MGRIFETRKATMFARWDKMAKAFTRAGRDIAMAVRAGGGNPESNQQLRRAILNARGANMPKDRIENAIKKALGGGVESYEELVYEGYAPHGIALMVVTATDNPTRTVANVRMHFNKLGGTLGSSGAVAFGFNRMCVFKLHAEGVDVETLELELIDHGLEELGETTSEKGEPLIEIRGAFSEFGRLQAAIEARGIVPVSSESAYIPTTPVSLPEDKATEVLALVDKLEQDDDVQHVFHNLI